MRLSMFHVTVDPFEVVVASDDGGRVQVLAPGRHRRDRRGSYVIASLMEKDGALIFLDAKTFKEIKRLPASKPIGKYNLHNKIQRSEGTSH